ncbi:MAG: hypothetical protein M1833_003935 [Piccolia ochrophora]|nr:MAG: hypothetical protein M1833_003935 [Piccolia ochrophora]
MSLLLHLPVELLLDIILQCSPEAIPAIRSTSHHFNDLFAEHETFVCDRFAKSLNDTPRTSLPQNAHNRPLTPTQRVQMLWHRNKLNKTLLRHVDLKALDAASKSLNVADNDAETVSPLTSSQDAIRQGLAVLWAYHDCAPSQESFIKSLSEADLDLLFGTAGICGDVLLQASHPSFFRMDMDDWNDEGLLMMGMDPQYYSFIELALMKGVPFVAAVLEGTSEEAVRSTRQLWGRATPALRENVHIRRLTRARRLRAAQSWKVREAGGGAASPTTEVTV